VKLLSDILYRVRMVQVTGGTNVAIEHISIDSRTIRPMSVFVAISGTLADGHQFIDQCIRQGAVAIVCERMPEQLQNGVTYIQVQDSSEALGYIACNYYDNPSEKIKIVAVTGTNGKTTTATLLYRLFRAMGHKTGLLSTVVNKINDQALASTHTTPNAIALNELLGRMVEAGCTHCFMEASSHALHQNRLTGIRLTGALFTNITHDHLDYHGTFNEYIKAKKKLFDQLPAQAFAITNSDSKYGDIMLDHCKAKHKSYALKTMADYKARILENSFDGLHMQLDGKEVYTRLIGSFNAYNLLLVYATGVELGIDKDLLMTTLSGLEAPEGRFEYVRSNSGIIGIVDYAHTPDALDNVLSTLHDIRKGDQNIITLIGCGGDRDKTKRPEMARIAFENSNRTILTSDNPRSENPEDILKDMQSGLRAEQLAQCLSLVDRKEAIKMACVLAQPGDIILVAGKGHEKYQEIAGVKHDFDDYQTLKETFQNLQK
jgi:UDP-N-acetylmuramoyl-L-alanyl-D-glutamate--2,6-diaminopimelate ligase